MSKAEAYDQIFTETFNVTKEALNDNFTFADNEKWDSMTHLVLISALEDEFDVMFDTEDILNYHSYENGKKILKRYGVEL